MAAASRQPTTPMMWMKLQRRQHQPSLFTKCLRRRGFVSLIAAHGEEVFDSFAQTRRRSSSSSSAYSASDGNSTTSTSSGYIKHDIFVSAALSPRGHRLHFHHRQCRWSWPCLASPVSRNDDATQRQLFSTTSSALSTPPTSTTPPPTTTTLTEQLTSFLPPTPDCLSNITFWGGTGFLLTTFHNHLHLPYWACISLTNICVRSAMVPIAIRGAQAQVKLSSVSPELQYLITSFTNDMKTLNAAGSFGAEGSLVKKQVLAAKPRLVRQTLSTMRGLLTMKHVNLFDIFKSPLLQIPFFVYFASDLRKIIEGSNPTLAQNLVESSFFWISDLTEPDPWYGLPIFTGLLLYMNVEIAVGKQSLGGEASSKSNMAILLKDGFQSLAIFMPCFMSQQPSGVQLYLATSMIFTLLQSRAMRNDTIRQAIGLPSIHVKPRSMSDSDIVKDFLAKMAERQAAKAKGGYVLGEGVHVTGANISVPRFGTKRRSSIVVEKDENEIVQDAPSRFVEIQMPEYTLRSPLLVQPEMFQSATPIPFQPGFVPGVFRHSTHEKVMEAPVANVMPEIPLSVMEAANRGEKLKEPVIMAPREALIRMQEENMSRKDRPIDAEKLKLKWNRRKGKR